MIQGVDKDGFEIYSVYLTGHVPIGRTRVLSTTSYLKDYLLKQIVNWQQN